ncbi:MAG: S-adenosylmethionine decarboxylase [Vicinamibacteria bacterium]
MVENARWSAGTEWIVDAFGCDSARLSSVASLSGFFDAVVTGLSLNPVASPSFHAFPGHGGVTGFVMLSESHLSCHTFPETGFAAFDLFCCRERPEWDWEGELAKALGATRVSVRRFSRGATETGGPAK